LDRKSPLAHLALADLFLQQSNSRGALEELKTAANLSPVRSATRLKYAEFKAKTGAGDDAKAILTEITRQAADYLPAWGCLAKFAYIEKKYEESLSFLENIFNRDAVNLEGRLLQSEVWLARGDLKLALDGLDRLNNTYPNVPIVKYELARAHLQNGSPAPAVVALNQALALDPNYEEAVMLLGEADLRVGDARPVIASMQDLLKKHPAQVEAQMLLAAAFQSLGQLDNAAAIFREQIRVSPGSAQSYLGLGVILREQGKTAEARKTFEKVQELEPQNLLALQHLVE
jgi:tetratricopeptide (TPR) repeat protein